MLHIELVPRPMWGKNARAVITPDSWEELRFKYGATSRLSGKKLKCKICGAKSEELDLHEVWHFDNQERVQKLIELIPICDLCHSVKHFGHTSSLGVSHYERAIQHLQKVNSWSSEQVVAHVELSMRDWEARSKCSYSLELTFLEKIIGKSRIHLDWLEKDNRYAKTKAEVILLCRELLSSDAVILDTETTGLLDRRSVEIIEVGVVDMRGEVLYERRFKPRHPSCKEAIKVHGITHEQLKDCPKFKDHHEEMSRVLSGKRVIAYNAKFDSSVLARTCDKYNLPSIETRWICAMWLYRNYKGGRWEKLPSGKHAAVADSLAVLELIRKMANEMA